MKKPILRMWDQKKSKWVYMGEVESIEFFPTQQKTFRQCVIDLQETWHKFLLECMYAWKLDKILNWLNKLLDKEA